MAIPGIGLILKAGTAVVSLVNNILGMRREDKLRDEGARKEREQFNKESRDVEKRMDDTKRAGSDDVADSLREGKF